MVTTLAPCWYCSGLVRQFDIGTVIVGESANFQGGIEWLRENGVEVVDLNSSECIEMMAGSSPENPKSGTRTSVRLGKHRPRRCRAGISLEFSTEV